MDYKKNLLKTIELSDEALKIGNHPCGCVITDTNGNVLTEDANEVFTTPDLCAHAEIRCIRKTSKDLMDKSTATTLFSSIEPCCGCAFFIARTNITKVIYAAKDRYRPGISMLKKDPKFDIYFKDIEIIEEPDIELRNRAMLLMKAYFISKQREDTAKFFDPKLTFN